MINTGVYGRSDACPCAACHSVVVVAVVVVVVVVEAEEVRSVCNWQL